MTKIFAFIFPLIWFMGCKDSPSSSSDDSRRVNSKSEKAANSGDELGKILFQHLGVSGTIGSDYKESVKLLSEMSSPSSAAASKSLAMSEIVDKFAGGFKDAIVSGNSWGEPDDSFSFSRNDPPISLLRYLVFCRILRNALFVRKNSECQRTMIHEAATFLTFTPRLKFYLFFDACEAMKLAESCQNFALTYTLSIFIMAKYVTLWDMDPQSVHLVNFLHTTYGLPIEYQRCPSQKQKDNYAKVHKKSFEVLKKSLEPPDEGICIEQHIRNILKEWDEFVSVDLPLLDCQRHLV